MKIVFCADENGGVSFSGRRQSRDKVLRKRLIEKTRGAKIIVSAYTASLFKDDPRSVSVCGDPFADAGEDDFVFAENTDVSVYEENADVLIIYKWNRLYPADIYYSGTPEERGWRLVSSFDFRGSSHDKITEEVYMK